ncbi:MAG: hypothetical protein ACRDQ4_26915, partial [Pseudonocardiaceae bacterium]
MPTVAPASARREPTTSSIVSTTPSRVRTQGPGKVLFRQIDAHRSLNERGDHDLVCSQCAEFDRRAARPAS